MNEISFIVKHKMNHVMKTNLRACIRTFVAMSFLLFSSSLISTPISAQTMDLSTPYVQNFDAIGTSATATLPAGWKADKLTSVRTVGSYTSTNAVTATTQVGGNNLASNATNGIYNFGAGDPASATDRAIGGLSSSSSSKSVNCYVQIQYTGTSAVNTLNISYDVEKYRNGTNSAGFSISLYYSYDGATWTKADTTLFKTSFSADGDNNGFASAPGSVTSVSNKALSLSKSLNPNDTIYLAWNYSVTLGTITSNAQALAIDNVSIQPVVVIGTNKMDTKGSNMHVFSLNKQIIIENAEAAIQLFDAYGKQIMHQTKPSERIAISVPQGLYIVKVGENNVKVLVK